MNLRRRALLTLVVGVLAVTFLGVDALLLGYAGLRLGRPLLVAAAVACLAAAALVIVAWLRYRRVLAEIAEGRREIKRDVELIRELLHHHHFPN